MKQSNKHNEFPELNNYYEVMEHCTRLKEKLKKAKHASILYPITLSEAPTPMRTIAKARLSLSDKINNLEKSEIAVKLINKRAAYLQYLSNRKNYQVYDNVTKKNLLQPITKSPSFMSERIKLLRQNGGYNKFCLSEIKSQGHLPSMMVSKIRDPSRNNYVWQQKSNSVVSKYINKSKYKNPNSIIANSKQVNVINSYEKELNKIQKSGRNSIGQFIPYQGKDVAFNPESDLKELSLKSMHAMKEIHSKMMNLEDELAI